MNTNKFTTSSDKITFHKNQIQIKVKHFPNGKFEKLNKKKEYLFPEKGKIKPLLIESFMLNENLSILSDDAKYDSDDEKVITSISEVTNFSLIIFLIPHDANTLDILLYSKLIIDNNGNEVNLMQFQEEGHSIGRIEGFHNDFDLLIFTTPYTPPIEDILKNEMGAIPNPPFRIINYQNPEAFLAKIARQYNLTEKNKSS